MDYEKLGLTETNWNGDDEKILWEMAYDSPFFFRSRHRDLARKVDKEFDCQNRNILTLKGAVEELEKDNKTLESRVGELLECKTANTVKMTELGKKNAQLEKQVKDHNKALKETTLELVQLEETNKTLNASISNYDNTVQRLEDDLHAAAKYKDMYQELVSQLKKLTGVTDESSNLV